MKVHIIGAGLAGLAAAVSLADVGAQVEVSEAAAQAGGRCRSYFDPQLGAVIDNGNHLVMSGNQGVNAYLRAIGAQDRLQGPDRAQFDFIDLKTMRRWKLRPNGGAAPWWVLDPKRRAPDTRAADYLALARLLHPKTAARVDQTIRPSGPVWERLVEPLLLAALNTDPKQGSARLAGAIVRETLAKGGGACRPRIAHPTLAAAFVDPALAHIVAQGGVVKLGRRLKSLTMDGERIGSLIFSDGETQVGPNEVVILAVPPWVAKDLAPSLSAPDDFRAIVNAHFMTAAPRDAPAMIGVVGGLTEWIFAFEDRVSVTISAADRLVDVERKTLVEQIWAEVKQVLGLVGDLPRWQIVKEKRATFAATVEQDRLRPSAKTPWRNLILAGDWTQTNLPATIEGAIRSGFAAARLATKQA